MIVPAIPRTVLENALPNQREFFESECGALAALAAADIEMDEFLNAFLRHLTHLFGVPRGALWLRNPGEVRLAMKARIGDGEGDLAAAPPMEREAILRFALSQRKAFSAAPRSVMNSRIPVPNPTDSHLFLGPVRSHGDGIGVIELAFPRTLLPPAGAAGSPSHLAWLDDLAQVLAQGIESRFLGNLAPLQPALVNLAATRAEIEGFKHAIQVSLEITLSSFAGWNFGSFGNNRTFTKNVQDLLDSNGLRVECPECGSPAILRCQAAGNAKTGVFVYDHYLESGRTFHGGPTTFPRLRLVPKPPRRNAQ